MSEKVVVTKEKLTAIGDAIREKTETSEGLGLDEMPEAIQGIQTGADFTINDASYLFYGGARMGVYSDIASLLKDVTNMNYMFYKCEGASVDFNLLDTGKVKTMSHMFDSSGFNGKLDLSNFDTSNVTDMSNMFVGMTLNLKELDLSSFDTSNVANMSYMFAACGSLSNLNISNFNTANVNNMSYMFNNCGSLTSIDISHFDTSKATNMNSMFNGCSKMEEIIGFSAINKAGLTIGFPKGTTSSRYALKRLIFKTDLPEGTYSIRSAINISYCAFDKAGMVEMFNSLPDITNAGVSANYKKITITGNPCLVDGTLTDDDRAIATNKGWTLVE